MSNHTFRKFKLFSGSSCIFLQHTPWLPKSLPRTCLQHQFQFRSVYPLFCAVNRLTQCWGLSLTGFMNWVLFCQAIQTWSMFFSWIFKSILGICTYLMLWWQSNSIFLNTKKFLLWNCSCGQLNSAGLLLCGRRREAERSSVSRGARPRCSSALQRFLKL